MAQLSREDQAAIRELWKKYRGAFDRKDAKAAAGVYASDGDLVANDGKVVAGSAAIEKLYAQLFAKYPKAALRDVKLAPARGVSGTVAIVNGNWNVVGVGPGPAPVVGTLIVRRERGVWKYVAVRFMTPIEGL